MSQNLTAPVLVLVDPDAPTGAAPAPAGACLDLLGGARRLTGGEVVALVLGDAGAPDALAAAGADRVLTADLDGLESLAGAAADALVAAARRVRPGVVLVVSDYRGKEIAGRAAILLGSACVSDVAALEVVDGELRASKLVLSGSWSTTMSVTPAPEGTPVLAVRPGAFGAEADGREPGSGRAARVEALEVEAAPASRAVRVVSRERVGAAAGPPLTEARTVVVGGRGVDGDFDLVRSLADPLGAAVGATRVACDEGWIERSAQIGQTGETISPRLYIGLGVSGAIHHTSGIQGAGTIVAVCDDSEAPIFEMADFGVIGDVADVVPQLVDELARLRG